MWVITRKINEYNQHGSYLVGVFERRPSIEEICKMVDCGEKFAKYLIETGGGREGTEYTWYYLTKLKHGEQYE